jgi:hypothetical protein
VHASSQLSIVLDGFDKEEKSKTPWSLLFWRQQSVDLLHRCGIQRYESTVLALILAQRALFICLIIYWVDKLARIYSLHSCCLSRSDVAGGSDPRKLETSTKETLLPIHAPPKDNGK